MLTGLLTAAFLMGLAGLPHCAAMCATPCAVALPAGPPAAAVWGRTAGYALLGAMAAGTVSTLAQWSRWAVVLQPFWVMLLLACVLLGGWMLLKGSLPQAMQTHGLHTYQRLRAWANEGRAAQRWPCLRAAMPAILGMAWAALPCGLLYGAVMVAALAPDAAQGALVMVAFSLPGALLLWQLPRRLNVWRWVSVPDPSAAANLNATAPVLWLPRQGSADMHETHETVHAMPPSRSVAPWWSAMVDPQWAIRISGGCLALASSWALVHRLFEQWQAWCA